MLKPLLSHDHLVEVFYCIVRSLLEYACPVFLNPGTILDAKFISLCKRAFRIIHGRDCTKCDSCNMLDVSTRRELLSSRLFNEALNNLEHSLHRILPIFSRTGKRLLLPHVRCSRRLKAFVFSSAPMYNKCYPT